MLCRALPCAERDPKDYSAMFDKAEVVSADGSSVQHFELVCCKCVDTYVAVKENYNQICWKYKKVRIFSWIVGVGAIIMSQLLDAGWMLTRIHRL
jgi:hypothetical protein